jgi:hypothetical protein
MRVREDQKPSLDVGNHGGLYREIEDGNVPGEGRGRMWMSRGEEMIRRKAGQDCEMGEDDIVSLLDSFCPRSLGKLNRASNHILSWAIIHGSTRQKVPKIEIRK